MSDDKPNDKTNLKRPGAVATPDHTVFRGGQTAKADSARVNTPAAGQPADATRAKQPSAADATRMRPHAPRGPASTLQVDTQRVLKGRFTLEKVIGVGGMGVVYKAIDRLKVEARDRDPYVAIKVLSEEFKSHPESFIALQRESRKTQRIAHPNVVKVFDFDRDGDIVFMTMEYLEGRPLDQLMSQYSATGLPHDDAWSILRGLCSALVHAHEEKIVHSDFKPGNIFITDSGVPKIFDFGIARAVAKVDRHASGARDVTVFDAGSLGALTPAYASLEMLLGQEPDVRDDIYALGCIAYEMLTGQHPFGRLPADEAAKRGLRPERIASIKRQQWKAIEKALAFKREHRSASAAEFYEGIVAQSKPAYLALGSAAFIVLIGIAGYFAWTGRNAQEGQSQFQLSEIEFGIRYNLFKEKIDKLLAERSFTEAWEAALWEEFSGLKTLLGEREDAWFAETRDKIYNLYVETYKSALAKPDYNRASVLLTNTYRYADDKDFLDAEKERLASLFSEAERKRLADAESRARVAGAQREEVADRKVRTSIFDLALRNVNQQLQCQGSINMREVSIAVEKLRQTDVARYKATEPGIVNSLAQCIGYIGKTQPERAKEAKASAVRLFPNNKLIADVKIVARDACSDSLAGLGARSETAICRDRISGLGAGPGLVVVPAGAGQPSYAIGRYEVSVREFNQFCAASKVCSAMKGDGAVPVTGISAEMANEYARWLSRVTGQRYRLPSRQEWTHAARATGRGHDPNRNCAFSTRGIQKGGKLVRVNVGVANSWGLVNYLGNSQEWVYDGHRLVVVGGSFEDGMERCQVGSVQEHSGEPDRRTGFRVMREMRR